MKTAEGKVDVKRSVVNWKSGVPVTGYTEEKREWNQNYILPVGYSANNMFIRDWEEPDFGELDFYDLFDLFYSTVCQQVNPYEKTVDGECYEVPADEFEYVIQTYFQIDREKLREKTVYNEKEQTYTYHTRGFYNIGGTPNDPYPEVVGGTKKDNLLTLTVNAVWPMEHTDRAFSHEVVIRLLDNGKFQYVSNHIIPSEDNMELHQEIFTHIP